MPAYGVHGDRAAASRTGRPSASSSTGRTSCPANTAFVDALCDAIEAAGGNALPVYCGSLRAADEGLMELLGRADALVVTVLAAGGVAANATAATRTGTPARSPRSTCRSCRACA